MANKSQISLTKRGHEIILQSGVGKAFRNFKVGDDSIRYDVTRDNINLSSEFLGGERTLVTVAPTCDMASSKPISKNKPTTKELQQDSEKLQWLLGRLDCGGTSYEAVNPDILVDLGKYFVYLNDSVNEYNYDKRLSLDLTDSVKANLQTLDPDTFTYTTKSTVNDVSANYVLNTTTSCDNYTNLNAFLMTVDSGKKQLLDNTSERFASPLLLLADTDENDTGAANNWKVSVIVNTWGYVVKSIDSTDKTFRRSDFLPVSDVEKMTEREIKEKFRVMVPACTIDNRNSNDNLFYLTDLAGTYSEGVDGLPTYTHRFFNANGVSLMTALVTKAKNYVKANFKESTKTPGLYERVITINVGNKSVGGKEYTNKQIDGGNMKITLQYNIAETDGTYADIVTWR
jgi:hypothetical protein